MKITALLACTILLAAPSLAQRKSHDYKLPTGALIIETQPVKTNRALILWVLNPRRIPRDLPDEPYTCPEETRGSYYSGATRVSLVDTRTRRIINTLAVRQEYNEGVDEFDTPYQIHSGSHYRVGDVPAGREGKPTIMWLRDYNGDGRALEFALFDALACMGLQTTLIGYSERQDKVIQYPVRLVVEDKGKRSVEIRRWVDYLFSGKPKGAGYWRYEIDYRGRGGPLAKYEIRYNRRAERFEGKVVYTEGE
ncbi:MAG TPA: hypothetical protein VF240_16705 [Pyrinomonadaceae bacterium]